MMRIKSCSRIKKKKNREKKHMTSRGLPRAAQLTGTVNKAMLLVDDRTQTKSGKKCGRGVEGRNGLGRGKGEFGNMTG